MGLPFDLAATKVTRASMSELGLYQFWVACSALKPCSVAMQ